MLGSRYTRYLLPGVLFQSTLIGGGYASGREIVEYGGRFGPLGLLTIAVIVVGFGLICALAFELARLMRAYDYHTLVRALIGPACWLFDVLFVAMCVLVVAVISATTGEVARDTLGIPYFPALVAVIAVVAAIILGGGHIIERFKTAGTAMLYGAFVVFGVLVLARFWPEVRATFAAGSAPDVHAGTALLSGVQYVSYNLVVLPAALFVLYRQTRRRESLASGAIAGVLASVPFVITFVCLMAFYPSEAVLGARVPWLAMLDEVAGPVVAGAYALVVLWTLVETATGLVHAITDRIDVGLRAAGRPALTPLRTAAVTVAMLAAAVGLAQFGIVPLVSRGYSLMAWGFLALFAVPLLTVGVYRIVTSARGTAVEAPPVSAGAV